MKPLAGFITNSEIKCEIYTMYCKSLLTCKTLVSHTFMRLKTCKENVFVKTMNIQHTQDQFEEQHIKLKTIVCQKYLR